MRKYYEAYDDRYRQVFAEDMQWFSDHPSPIVEKTIQRYHITKRHRILELGCGEGRDAVPLLEKGYDLLATDVSPAAIGFCQRKYPEVSSRFAVLDCVSGELSEKFDFTYAVAVIHMLAQDADRDAFLGFIRSHLKPSGIALICTMGDGMMERQTDIRAAFELQDRTHEQTGKKLQIAATSCRMVSFETLHGELKRNGLRILEEGTTAAPPDFPVMMYAVVTECF